MRPLRQMPTTITIDHHAQQNLESSHSSSSRSASQSDSFSDEDSGSYDLSDHLGDETWEEIEPSESASRPRSRPRTTPTYTTREVRPTRRHTSERAPAQRAPRIHRPVHRPPSSVEGDEYPGYGRGYPHPGSYAGAPMPRPGYAASAFSTGPPPGAYAPPFGGAPGALTHYGPQGGGYGQQYQQSNPFSPHPPPVAPPGGAGYFNGPHHAMSTHGGVMSPYGGHEMMPYPGMPGYPPQPSMYPGYPPQGMSPQHMQYYPQQWPPNDNSITPDPEAEKRILAMEEMMKNHKIDSEKNQEKLAMELTARDAALAARDAMLKARDEAEIAAKKQKEVDAQNAAKAAADLAAWEKRLADEKKEAQKQGAENAKKQIEAEKKKAEEKAAEEKEKADMKAAVEKAEKERKEGMDKVEKEKKEEVEKAVQAAKELVEKAEKEAKEKVDQIEKERREAVEKALAPKDDKKKPIKFKDAVGRKFSFPFHLCATWAGMEELIKQAFMHVDLLGPFVAEGHYDLIGPNGEIILPQVWETMIEPDWSITMHMWPMPEKPAGPPAPPQGHHQHDRAGGKHSHRQPTRPPTVPPGAMHRGPPAPPVGAAWPPGRQAGPGPGPGPRIIGSSPPVVSGVPLKASRRKTEPASKGVLGWMVGKPAKPSGKGPKKAEPPACLVM